MSVAQVMETVAAQESAQTQSGPVESDGVESGHTTPVKQAKQVRSIEDLFNETYEDDEPKKADKDLDIEKEKVIEGKDDKKEEKEEKKEEKEEEKKEDQKEDKKEEKKDSKKQFVKVKINGVDTDVELQDVINSYSGQKEIQKRFTEFDKQKKEWEKSTQKDMEFSKFVKDEFTQLRTDFESILGQYEKNGFVDRNPVEIVNNLLDKMGLNSNIYERALFEHLLPDYAKFFNMTDVERDAFYAKKENEYLKKKERGFIERDSAVKLREETQQKNYELIKSAGLDSVKYEELSKELSDAGVEDLTTEKVVEYAKQKPVLDRIVGIFNEAGLNAVGDERARTIHQLLTEFPDTTNEEILDYLVPDRVAMRKAKVLNEKAPKVEKPVLKKGEDEELNEMLNWFKR